MVIVRLITRRIIKQVEDVIKLAKNILKQAKIPIKKKEKAEMNT